MNGMKKTLMVSPSSVCIFHCSFCTLTRQSSAEDNPANDYPEDEVSSDDQFSRNPYKYRQYHSDNEYDDDFP